MGIPYSKKAESKHTNLGTLKIQLTNRLFDDVSDLLDLLFGHFTSALGVVDLGDAGDQMSESATETLDDTETESGLLLSVDVGVLHTQNVLEISSVLKYKWRLQ